MKIFFRRLPPRFVAPALLWLAGMHAARAADPVSVGDPGSPASLPQAIYDAHQQGAMEITIRPGTYRLPPMQTADTLMLDRWHDTTIHAANVVILCEETRHSALLIRGGRNVTWEGGTLEYPHPAMTQGRIVAMGSDANGSTCDWRIDAGYPTDIDAAKSTYDVVDAASRSLKVGTGDWTPKSVEPLPEPGSFRFHYQNKPDFAVNDWLVTRAPGGSLTAHLDECENCTLRGVTCCNGGFANFFETGGPGGNHYLGCKIQPGPRPPGATVDEIVACGADGFHSKGTVVGPDIEDCVFTGVFLDDCIAIHGRFGRVIRADANTVVLKKGGGDPVVGDPLRISDTHGFFAEGKVTAAEPLPGGDVRVTLDQDLRVPIDHRQDNEDKLGTKANNPNRCGRGFKILRCQLGHTRSRGILVKADDGTISDCVIEGCGMSGVSIGPEFWWGEANYCWNVSVSNNRFVRCTRNNGEEGTIWVHGDGAIGNRHVLLKDNVLDTCYGPNIFRLEDVDEVRVTGNHVVNPFTFGPKKTGSSILFLKNSTKVTVGGNEVRGPGKPPGELVHLEPGMKAADVRNDGGSGFVVKISGSP